MLGRHASSELRLVEEPELTERDLPEPPLFAQQVLEVVDAIPPGRVMAYGHIAEFLGSGGPRQVGRVMSTWGGAVPWHRVVHADGTPATCHDGAALAMLRADRTPMRGERVDMARARFIPLINP